MTNAVSPVPKLSILVVAYNSGAVIAACLAAIPAACRNHAYEVLMVDNGDGSTEALVARDFAQVKIVASRGNVGFAAGNNLLAAEARGEYLVLLNPDLELKSGALDALLEAAAAYPTASAWGGVTLDRHDRPDLGNTLDFPSLKEMASRLFGRSIATTSTPLGIDCDTKVEVLSGSFAMFSRSAWDEVGGLDERYFLYCEEVDMFYRLAQRGHSFWRIGAARGFHDIGHGDAGSPRRQLYLHAGIMQFARLHWSRPRQFAAFLLIWIGATQRFVAGYVLAGVWASAARMRDKNRDLALRPSHWRHGYDPERGLLARLNR